MKDLRSLDLTLQAVFDLIWGQCSKVMQDRLKAVEDWDVIQEDGDATRLLKEIRTISQQLEVNVSISDALGSAKAKYYSYFQFDHDTNSKHLKTFKELVSVIEHYGRTSMWHDTKVIEYVFLSI